jgi:hypothetical protein
MSALPAGVDGELLLVLWGFKAWVEMALDEGSIIAPDWEYESLRWLLRRIDCIRIKRDAIVGRRGERP